VGLEIYGICKLAAPEAVTTSPIIMKRRGFFIMERAQGLATSAEFNPVMLGNNFKGYAVLDDFENIHHASFYSRFELLLI
jgi:hypothetical protein